jgi:hypothetical protein
MVFREVFENQDFRRMSRHAERDHETKKLISLIERVNRQLADRGKVPSVPVGVAQPPVAALPNATVPIHLRRLSVLDS